MNGSIINRSGGTFEETCYGVQPAACSWGSPRLCRELVKSGLGCTTIVAQRGCADRSRTSLWGAVNPRGQRNSAALPSWGPRRNCKISEIGAGNPWTDPAI